MPTNDVWQDVRAGVATKLGTAEGVRRATWRTEEPLTNLPEIRLGMPTFELLQQTGNTERYTLEFPFEIVARRPGGRARADAEVATLARAVQEAFFGGVTMSGIVTATASIEDARLGTMLPGLTEYAEQDADGRELYDGYRGSVIVQVYETLTRTA